MIWFRAARLANGYDAGPCRPRNVGRMTDDLIECGASKSPSRIDTQERRPGLLDLRPLLCHRHSRCEGSTHTLACRKARDCAIHRVQPWRNCAIGCVQSLRCTLTRGRCGAGAQSTRSESDGSSRLPVPRIERTRRVLGHHGTCRRPEKASPPDEGAVLQSSDWQIRPGQRPLPRRASTRRRSAAAPACGRGLQGGPSSHCQPSQPD